MVKLEIIFKLKMDIMNIWKDKYVFYACLIMKKYTLNNGLCCAKRYEYVFLDLRIFLIYIAIKFIHYAPIWALGLLEF